MMHQPVDGSIVKGAIRPGYRIWFVPRAMAPVAAAITDVRVRSSGHDIAPVAESDERFFVGTVPSHGIIEPLRARFPEYVFDRLPPGNFIIVADTSRGRKRFAVTERERASVLRVCN
jgi:hypothetical protein